MGQICAENLFPPHWSRPDDAQPIGTWSPSPALTATCVGFAPRHGDEILFEGETPLQVRWSERTWRYRYPGKDGAVRISNRWRMEIIADPKQTHLRPGNNLVVVREPYGTNWIQTASFKMYSKKSESEREEAVVPQLRENEHPVDWLERNLKYDPWETGAHYVAGISFPNGFQEEARNVSGGFLFGACPDFDGLVEDMFKTRGVEHMLHLTKENKIRFAFPGADLETEPILYPEVIRVAKSIMGTAIQQALAGPGEPRGDKRYEKWEGQPVSKLVWPIYCDHLNDYNRRESRRLLREVPFTDDVDSRGSARAVNTMNLKNDDLDQ